MTVATIQPFSFEGHPLRYEDDGDPWFRASDACEILGLDNVSQALAGLDEDEKGLRTAETPGGLQRLLHVTEPGLYRLVMVSRKPEAKRFQRWVTHEVLPAIRRTGSYAAASAALDLRDPAALQRLALQLTGIVQEQQQALAAAAPKVEAFDSLMTARGSVCLQIAAKDLHLPPNLFVRWLRTQGHVYSRGRSTVARSDHVEAGRMTHRTVTVGEEKFTQVLMTPRGIAYFATRRPELQRARRAPLPRPNGNPLLALPGGHP